MSNQTFPMPIDTPLGDDPKAFRVGMAWSRFFKSISDSILKSNIIVNALPTAITSPTVPTVTQTVINTLASSFKYVLNANLCFITYSAAAPYSGSVVVNLPYTAALPFDFGGVTYPAGTKSVTIAPTTAYLRFWYVAEPTKNRSA